MKTTLIVITGLPCTGKTTLANKIAEELKLPLISKDEIKEKLFEELGYKDIEQSERISKMTYTTLFEMVESNLKANISTIVESNFSAQLSNDIFLDLKNRYDFSPIQIRCITDGNILVERFKQRANTGERHPGHFDSVLTKELEPYLLKGKITPLDIGGEFMDIDTSDFEKIDYEELYKELGRWLV